MQNKVLQYIFQNVDTLIFLISNEGDIIDYNGIVYENLNLKQDYLKNTNIFDLIKKTYDDFTLINVKKLADD